MLHNCTKYGHMKRGEEGNCFLLVGYAIIASHKTHLGKEGSTAATPPCKKVNNHKPILSSGLQRFAQ